MADAAQVLKGTGLVAFPTETFYGLGADASQAAAVRRVFAVKGRQESKPLLVLVDSVAMAESLVEDIPARARALIDRHWPGPLTLVLRARSDVPPALTAGTGTIGIRISGHPVARALVQASGVPVTAPSANMRAETPPRTAEEVLQVFTGRIELVLDGGATAGGAPSTVVDVTVDPPKVLRAGAVAF
jgi:L-threonylcarbamoyladenylate synthase